MIPRGYRQRLNQPSGVRAVTTAAVGPAREEITAAYQSAQEDRPRSMSLTAGRKTAGRCSAGCRRAAGCGASCRSAAGTCPRAHDPAVPRRGIA